MLIRFVNLRLETNGHSDQGVYKYMCKFSRKEKTDREKEAIRNCAPADASSSPSPRGQPRRVLMYIPA